MPSNNAAKSASPADMLSEQNITKLLQRAWQYDESKGRDTEWSDIVDALENITRDGTATFTLDARSRAAIFSALGDKYAQAFKEGQAIFKSHAQQAYENAFKIDPGFVPNLDSYARFLLADDNPELAEVYLAHALIAKGDEGLTPHLGNLLSRVYEAQGEPRLAQLCLGWTLEQTETPEPEQLARMERLAAMTGEHYSPFFYTYSVVARLEKTAVESQREPVAYLEAIETRRQHRLRKKELTILEEETATLVHYSQTRSDKNLLATFTLMAKKNARFGEQKEYAAEMGRLYFEMLKTCRDTQKSKEYQTSAQHHLARSTTGPAPSLHGLYVYAKFAQFMQNPEVAIGCLNSLSRFKSGGLSALQTLELATLYYEIGDHTNALQHAQQALALFTKTPGKEGFAEKNARQMIVDIQSGKQYVSPEQRELEATVDVLLSHARLDPAV